MNEIRYVTGDATDPERTGLDVIVHVCNNVGGWGAGFVLALSARWPEPEDAYRRWAYEQARYHKPFELGEIDYVDVGTGLTVANLIGQDGVRTVDGVPPVRYDAIRQGLTTLALDCKQYGAAVHMPRIGCGLAGGDWSTVAEIINRTLIQAQVPVTVYDLP